MKIDKMHDIIRKMDLPRGVTIHSEWMGAGPCIAIGERLFTYDDLVQLADWINEKVRKEDE